MTDLIPPAVVPPLHAATPAAPPRWIQMGAPVPSTSLSLPALPSKRVGSVVYGQCTLDRGGRIADRSITAALGWVLGFRVQVRVSGGVIALFPGSRGEVTVTAKGFLRVPVAARRWCNLEAGDRVLLAAYPEGELLLVLAPAVLDQAVTQVFEAAWGGNR